MVEVLVLSIMKGVWIVRAWLPSHAIPRPGGKHYVLFASVGSNIARRLMCTPS